MTSSDPFYLCPTCFAASTRDQHLHEHRMITVSLRGMEVDQRRPLVDASGRLLTRAPRWFVASTHPIAAGQVGGAPQSAPRGDT